MDSSDPSMPTKIAAVRSPGRRESASRLYDVGDECSLTIAEIAKATGATQEAICQRIRKGVRGFALMLPAGLRRLVDVGDGRHMTHSQIAAHAGITESGVCLRLQRGLKGRALLAPGPKRGRS